MSLLAHALVLAIIGLSTPRLQLPPRAPEAPAMQVALVPERSIPRSTPPEELTPAFPASRTATAGADRSALRPVPRIPAAASPALPQPAPKPTPRAAPASTQPRRPPPPATARAAPSPVPASRPGSPTPVRPAAAAAPSSAGVNEAAAARQALRESVGCDSAEFLRLNPAERARCDRRMGLEARRQAPFLSTRQSYVDAANAQEETRRDREAPLPELITRCEGAFSNLGVGCLPPKKEH